MHRCWEIPELLAQIFDNVLYDPRSLAALAGTCRLFSDLALDLLWGIHGDMLVLLKTMPSSLWREELRAYGTRKRELVKHLLLDSYC